MTQTVILSATKLWRAYPREAAVVGTLGLAAMFALAGAAYSTPSLTGLGIDSATLREPPPAPPPLLVRKLAPADAVTINQTIPLADSPNPAARPFALRGADEATRARALECLTSAIYYEAGNESPDGQRAVAQVVLNRLRHPAFPASVCEVVYQGSTRETGCQFTFTCDGSLARRPSADAWSRARKIAEAALAGVVFAPAGWATHYHANYVVPYWASSLAKNAIVGAHIFYRWAGGWGRPAAFGKRYAGREPNTEALKSAAVAAEAAYAAQQAAATTTAELAATIPGAEVKKPEEGRLAIRFNLAARKAVEEAPRHDYVEKFQASDNLRWSLSGAAVEAEEKPLGKAPPTIGAAGGGGGASQL
ncbi:cell wall hydrolase [Sphingomonas sp.]|uniref:cell wall hydrolase n=1 Tax=Sphingomonas sp. TaxID=28214 RepID=UPI0025D6DDD9|nr:cell wall hydrolase [Sphingomonas sp.]